MIYLELFWTFFKIGLFTFGGGYAMLPLVQQEVLAHSWLSTDEIVNFIAVSESTPGPFAVNMSTYVGRLTGGIFGAFCATLGVVAPSFIIILIVAKFYEKFRRSRLVEGAMSGLRPVVVGLICASIFSIGRQIFVPGETLPTAALAVSIGIFLIMAVLAFKKVHPIIIIAASAATGIAAGYIIGL
ncbi:MAG: chromate transporter [Clostridia bacterium]|nr:chromate transporter [Clostridia bacterium]